MVSLRSHRKQDSRRLSKIIEGMTKRFPDFQEIFRYAIVAAGRRATLAITHKSAKPRESQLKMYMFGEVELLPRLTNSKRQAQTVQALLELEPLG